MSYFDDKSEVIKIELTQHGKRLLSKGNLKPVYYAFFDDDVVYDSQFINVAEEQNDIQERILNKTPVLKPQNNFLNLEKEINTKISLDLDLNKPPPPEDDANNSCWMPLGLSSFNSEFYPSWNLMVLNGEILSSTNLVQSDVLQPYLKIPQINLKTLEYKIKTVSDVEKIPDSYEILYVEDGETPKYVIGEKPKNIFDFIEKNVDDLKENFDIEIFVEEQKEENIKYWKRLEFFKMREEIENEILLDEQAPETIRFPDENNVDHYLEILVDEEIVDISTYINKDANIGDVYKTNIKDGVFGEDC
jgi:hypothetical protein